MPFTNAMLMEFHVLRDFKANASTAKIDSAYTHILTPTLLSMGSTAPHAPSATLQLSDFRGSQHECISAGKIMSFK